MASTISAGTTAGTAIAIAGDTSGELQLRTNGTTTAVTINASQAVTFAKDAVINNVTVGHGGGNVAHNVVVANTTIPSGATGDYNNAFGWNTLNALTTGASNQAFGNAALYANTTGSSNTAIGETALFSNTTASNNTAVGYSALYSKTTGYGCVAIGASVLYANTTGEGNVGVGGDTGYYAALKTNTTGSYNCAFGTGALYANTTASNNTAVGSAALYNNTTASNNTAVGYTALYNNTTGASNTALGLNALNAAVTANGNTAIGSQALTAVTSSYNTCIGQLAGSGITSGGPNVCIGVQSGNHDVSLTTGSNNILVGSYTDVSASGASNQIVLGFDVTCIGDNYFTFGSGTGANRVYNQFSANASWTRSSDQRLKKEITTNTELGLNFINDLRTVSYKWKSPAELDQSMSDYDASQTEPLYQNKMYGLIAQEVKEILDNHNITDFAGWSVTSDEQGAIQGISYEMFVMPLIKAIQELNAKVDAQAAEIAALKGAQ